MHRDCPDYNKSACQLVLASVEATTSLSHFLLLVARDDTALLITTSITGENDKAFTVERGIPSLSAVPLHVVVTARNRMQLLGGQQEATTPLYSARRAKSASRCILQANMGTSYPASIILIQEDKIL
jgi:hypothetical protein